MFKREDGKWKYIARKSEFVGMEGATVPSHHLIEVVYHGGNFELHRVHADGKLPTVQEILGQIEVENVDMLDMIFDLGVESGQHCLICHPAET